MILTLISYAKIHISFLTCLRGHNSSHAFFLGGGESSFVVKGFVSGAVV